MLLHELRLFFVALQFLTRCPTPRWVGFEPAWLQQSARHFPAVGLLVGGFAALVMWLSLLLWPPMVAVGLSMAASVWLTGGFHEDGLADCCDGLGGAVSRDRALEIMKDSRLGSYGALGLVLVLGLKAACLTALVQASPALAVAALVWAQGASRAAAVGLMASLSYVGDAAHAKAKPLVLGASGATLAAALAWVLAASLVAALCWPMAVLLALPACAAAALLMQRWLLRRLGGFTGDTLGAGQQFSELAALLAWLAAAAWA